MQESAEGGCKFNIVQPGSSVATALSEGESKKKHIVLLEVNGEQFRTINYPLESVRPFIHDNVRPSTPALRENDLINDVHLVLNGKRQESQKVQSVVGQLPEKLLLGLEHY